MTATQLGRVQLLILQILWKKRRATAREITDALNESAPVAHSTVQTLLRGLEEKGSVSHETEGRTFVFFPLVEEDRFQRSATRDLVQRAFGGNVGSLVAHLLKNEHVSSRELSEIRRLIGEGKSDAEVYDFLVQRYGEFVLYRPRMSGVSLLLWLAPGIFLLLGGFVVYRVLRKRMSLPIDDEANPLQADQ